MQGWREPGHGGEYSGGNNARQQPEAKCGTQHGSSSVWLPDKFVYDHALESEACQWCAYSRGGHGEIQAAKPARLEMTGHDAQYRGGNRGPSDAFADQPDDVLQRLAGGGHAWNYCTRFPSNESLSFAGKFSVLRGRLN